MFSALLARRQMPSIRSFGYAAKLALLVLTCAGVGCSRKLETVGVDWALDGAKRAPQRALYRTSNGRAVLVDRAVSVVRYYDYDCVVYQRAEEPLSGTFFAACGDRTPVAVVSLGGARWRPHPDGLRRRTRDSGDGRLMLAGELIPIDAIKTRALAQPPWSKGWAPGNPDPELMQSITRDQPIDVHGFDSVGNPSLNEAIVGSVPDLLEDLLAAGADIEAENAVGMTPVMIAAGFGRTAAVDRLIAARARLDHQDGNGRTALMYAARARNIGMVKRLLAAGASRTPRDDADRTAADWAAAASDPELHALLIQGGATAKDGSRQ